MTPVRIGAYPNTSDRLLALFPAGADPTPSITVVLGALPGASRP